MSGGKIRGENRWVENRQDHRSKDKGLHSCESEPAAKKPFGQSGTGGGADCEHRRVDGEQIIIFTSGDED